jgi:hypothetical protein
MIHVGAFLQTRRDPTTLFLLPKVIQRFPLINKPRETSNKSPSDAASWNGLSRRKHTEHRAIMIRTTSNISS